MTKFQSTTLGIGVAIVLLSAIVLISAQASMRTNSAMDAGSISPNALLKTVDVSKLPVQDKYPAF